MNCSHMNREISFLSSGIGAAFVAALVRSFSAMSAEVELQLSFLSESHGTHWTRELSCLQVSSHVFRECFTRGERVFAHCAYVRQGLHMRENVLLHLLQVRERCFAVATGIAVFRFNWRSLEGCEFRARAQLNGELLANGRFLVKFLYVCSSDFRIFRSIFSELNFRCNEITDS